MVKIELKKFVFLFLIILFIGATTAVFTLGKQSYSITKFYGPEDNITGWINISLSNQQINTSIESSLGGAIKLTDLLSDDKNSDFVFTCNPTTCSSNYAPKNGESIKNFNLINNGSILIGFLINGKSISDASDFKVDFESDNPESEKIPLMLDFLNDGQIDWQAYNSSDNFGEENFGCYKGIVGETKIATIASDQAHQYCEKIELSVTPAVEIGAYVLGTGAAEFTMGIKGINEGSYKPCIATATGSGLQRIVCSPDYQVKQAGDYFVCIRRNNGATYQINFETNNVCGFTGNYNYQYQNDYNIFASQSKFASSIKFTLNNTELIKANSPTANLEADINDYLTNFYRNNCSEGCVIPIRVHYNVGQNLKISNPRMSYYSSGVLLTDTVNKIYDVEEVPPIINSKAQKLFLDNAGFKTPASYGDYTLLLTLGGVKIFSENISIGKVPTISSITPTMTGVGYPTKYKVKTSSDASIVKYSWDFGDGKKQDTTINEISYTYGEAGQYSLTITVVDKNGKSSTKTFVIYVALASEITPGLLEEADANIQIIKAQILTLSQFEQRSVNQALNLEQAEETINDLKITIGTAESEEDYEKILGQLLTIKIPETIVETTATSEIVFYPQEDNINLDTLAEITSDTYDSNKAGLYRQAIMSWDEMNVVSNLVFKEISAIYGGNEESLLKIFNFHVTNGYEDAYFVIKKVENILFESDYAEEELEDYYYIELDQPEKYVTFSTTEEVDFTNLPAFISPAISELVLPEWSPFQSEGVLKKWILFTIIIVIVLLITFVVWVILQWWYRVKYEGHLFKDRNNLYNLVNYIGNEKKKGTKEKDIITKLRKAGWNSEQLRYAVKKYDNKNTGMLEIIRLDKITDKDKKTIPQKK